MKNSSNNQVSSMLSVLVFAFFALALVAFAFTLYNMSARTTGYASGYINITVNTAVVINVTNSSINWGPGLVTAPFTNATLFTRGIGTASVTNGNWSITNVKAIVVANIGNVNCSLVANGVKTAATFFSGTANEQAYQWNITNGEAGACGVWSETSMQNAWATVNTSAATICNKLDFHTDKNEMFIDVKLVVPYDAANTGAQSDTLTIVGNAAI